MIDVTTPSGLRERALIALVAFSFARFGAALAMKVEAMFVRNPVHVDHCFRLIAITWSTGSRSLIPVIAIALAVAACGPVRLAVLNPR